MNLSKRICLAWKIFKSLKKNTREKPILSFLARIYSEEIVLVSIEYQADESSIKQEKGRLDIQFEDAGKHRKKVEIDIKTGKTLWDLEKENDTPLCWRCACYIPQIFACRTEN